MHSMKEKLRIGLLLDGDLIPHWAYSMLQKIQESGAADIVLLIKNQTEPRPQVRKSLLRRIWGNRKQIAYILYRKLDERKYRPASDAFEPRAVSGLVNADSITVTPIRNKFSDRFPEDAIARIREYRPDLLIRLGFRILRGSILQAATYGVWSYHHGDNRINRGGPAGFWEVMEQLDETGVVLQILNEDLDNGYILHRAFSPTSKSSVRLNCNNYFWKAALILPDKIAALHAQGKERFFAAHAPLNTHPQFYSQRLYVEPTNREMLKGLWRLLRNRIRWSINQFLYLEQWMLLFHLNREAGPGTSLFRYKKIIPPADRFWADPFVLYRDHQYYIFLEELLFRENKGFISLMTMDEKGNYTAPRKILERPYHLSYPFVFEDQGTYYMIPESIENRTIELYKCTRFPDQWELHQVLLKGVRAVDSTLVKHENRYYLFTTLQRTEGSTDHDELFIYHSDRLDSDHWISHPKNPVITDTKTGRAAGSFFYHNGQLYRPAQDCSKYYGYCVHLQQVTRLDPEDYAEQTVNSIYPDWDRNIIATHTINWAHKLTLADGLLRRKKRRFL